MLKYKCYWTFPCAWNCGERRGRWYHVLESVQKGVYVPHFGWHVVTDRLNVFQAWWWEEGIRTIDARLWCSRCCQQGQFCAFVNFFLTLLLLHLCSVNWVFHSLMFSIVDIKSGTVGRSGLVIYFRNELTKRSYSTCWTSHFGNFTLLLFLSLQLCCGFEACCGKFFNLLFEDYLVPPPTVGIGSSCPLL